ncbi:uncharacterized protein LOC122669850 isoform X2 [Telopea speciosissima]|uniref:uncharacterized protein LOC122669850 isoform X2 n=1 Tax=Telopea speciosissima TaxID=54955 RepID=UPI001CC3D319|nr:uncharacterized protein LOC122669850 isoform X2 [Telopea speciosissima]
MVGSDLSTEELCKASPKLSKPVIAVNPHVTVLDDFCPPIVEQFIDFDSIDDWVVEYDPVEMSIGGSNHCPLGSVTNTSVEETLKRMADEIPFVEGAVPGKLENLGSQIVEGMEKVTLVVTSESSDQISIKSELVVTSESSDQISSKSEKLEELDEKGSDERRAIVQSVTEETKVVVNGELGFKVSLDTNLEKPEAVTSVSGPESVELSDEDENDSSSRSESDISSSSSSSSSSSEEEDEEEEEEEDKGDMVAVGEIEEGEIRDLDNGIVAESDDEEEACMLRGSIRSNNELEILPPVPHVDVALEPHHHTLPVGVISSIMGTKIVVEGLENHNPLNEGSILWITEARLPLGLVDEIFGPVKNPYYVVRYNSDTEIPAGIHEGTSVSFVEAFANHVLNDQNLYKKGYDASGENDEELSDEGEFSDDEKEAEYRRMQRIAKRGIDDRQLGNRDFVDRKKAPQKGEFRKKIHPSAPPPACGSRPRGIPNQCHTNTPSVIAPVGFGSRPRGIPTQCHTHTPSVAAPVGCGGCACSHSTGPGIASMSTNVPSVSQVGQATYCTPQHLFALNNGVWTNGMQSLQQPQQQQQQHAVFPNINGLPSQQQNVSLPGGQHFQYPHPFFMNLPNGMPIQQQQQFDPTQMLLPSMALPYGQPNFSTRPASTPWTGFVGQPGFSQATFGMGFQGQLGHSSMNSGEQGVMSSGSWSCSEQGIGLQPSMNSGEQGVMSSGSWSCSEQGNGLQPPGVTQRSFASPQKFHQGTSSTHGRKLYRRGGSSFVGGRGRRQSG